MFKFFDGVVLQCFNYVLNEMFGVYIDYFCVWFMCYNVVFYCVQQVSFIQICFVIEEQGVVGVVWVICYLMCCCVGQLVRFIFDEVIKCVFYVNVRVVGWFCWCWDIILVRVYDCWCCVCGLYLCCWNGCCSWVYCFFLQ